MMKCCSEVHNHRGSSKMVKLFSKTNLAIRRHYNEGVKFQHEHG